MQNIIFHTLQFSDNEKESIPNGNKYNNYIFGDITLAKCNAGNYAKPNNLNLKATNHYLWI